MGPINRRWRSSFWRQISTCVCVCTCVCTRSLALPFRLSFPCFLRRFPFSAHWLFLIHTFWFNSTHVIGKLLANMSNPDHVLNVLVHAWLNACVWCGHVVWYVYDHRLSTTRGDFRRWYKILPTSAAKTRLLMLCSPISSLETLKRVGLKEGRETALWHLIFERPYTHAFAYDNLHSHMHQQIWKHESRSYVCIHTYTQTEWLTHARPHSHTSAQTHARTHPYTHSLSQNTSSTSRGTLRSLTPLCKSVRLPMNKVWQLLFSIWMCREDALSDWWMDQTYTWIASDFIKKVYGW